MATTLDDLASRVVATTTGDSPTSTRTDRGNAIEIAMKISTLATILIVGSIGYLALERAIGVKTITMIRIWSPVVAWTLMAFFKKPFLRGGAWFALATLTMIPALSGHLWQMFQGLVGAR